MPEPGYIYIALNPAMPNMVKIGRTSRSPGERLAELSSGTNVPVPFILIYDVFVENCSYAEALIHRKLQALDYRVSNNREFFDCPVKEAIKLVQTLEQGLAPALSTGGQVNQDLIDIFGQPEPENAERLFDLAKMYHKGERGPFKDERRAFQLYRLASLSGSLEADLALGEMLRHGEGCEIDPNLAKRHYQRAADGGSLDGRLGIIHLHIDRASHLKAFELFCEVVNEIGPHEAFENDALTDVIYKISANGSIQPGALFSKCADYAHRLCVREHEELISLLKSQLARAQRFPLPTFGGDVSEIRIELNERDAALVDIIDDYAEMIRWICGPVGETTIQQTIPADNLFSLFDLPGEEQARLERIESHAANEVEAAFAKAAADLLPSAGRSGRDFLVGVSRVQHQADDLLVALRQAAGWFCRSISKDAIDRAMPSPNFSSYHDDHWTGEIITIAGKRLHYRDDSVTAADLDLPEDYAVFGRIHQTLAGESSKHRRYQAFREQYGYLPHRIAPEEVTLQRVLDLNKWSGAGYEALKGLCLELFGVIPNKLSSSEVGTLYQQVLETID